MRFNGKVQKGQRNEGRACGLPRRTRRSQRHTRAVSPRRGAWHPQGDFQSPWSPRHRAGGCHVAKNARSQRQTGAGWRGLGVGGETWRHPGWCAKVGRGKRSDRRVSPFRRSGGIIAQMFWFHKTKLKIGEGIRPQIAQIFGEGKGGGERRREKDRSANLREFSPMNFSGPTHRVGEDWSTRRRNRGTLQTGSIVGPGIEGRKHAAPCLRRSGRPGG